MQYFENEADVRLKDSVQKIVRGETKRSMKTAKGKEGTSAVRERRTRSLSRWSWWFEIEVVKWRCESMGTEPSFSCILIPSPV